MKPAHLLLLGLLLASPVMADDSWPEAMVDGYYNIGDIHQEVSTKSPEAQTWFDRGLALCYGFNHEEAVRCFDKAIEADPELAIAYAGKAYALGPNFNNMDIAREQMLAAHQASEKAVSLAADATEGERAVIQAMAHRTGPDIPEDFTARRPYNEAYAEAMRGVYEQYGENPNVAELFAESLMNLQPWKHWTKAGEPGEHTTEILEVLERGMEQHPKHPGLCHLYIHAIEASPNPERALEAAKNLGEAVPGSGHLIHMPTHIYVLLGDYDNVIKRNARGVEVDKLFLEREGPANFYSLYRIHNYHFLVYGAMFDGQSQLAYDTALEIKDQVPEEMLKQFVDFLDGYMPTDLHVLVRFGKWDAILEQPEPADYLPMSRAIWHYARTLAYASTGQVEEAEDEYAQFEDAVEEVPESSYVFQNASLKVLEVADAMAQGEIAYRKGEFDQAFDHLREAVRLDDALNYDEPWGWMQPARHALGALLLEQGHYAEAEQAYREDLERHPKNPWALHGLAESLKEQGKVDAAADVREQFTAACCRSDVSIDRSCFCRLEVDSEPVESEALETGERDQ